VSIHAARMGCDSMPQRYRFYIGSEGLICERLFVEVDSGLNTMHKQFKTLIICGCEFACFLLCTIGSQMRTFCCWFVCVG
ncbi:hypothetical protein, partial [Porphyromonas cangingivalis]|uniref:hypothetical protein n=1 Tax=Porphyromonas cangingivalis TaxID=36874 RepID=UPI001F317AF2